MKRYTYILLFLLLLLPSCGEYQQVLKSKDPEYKYQMALQYFEQGKYVRSQTLLDDVAPYYKGTERAQDVIIYQARSYMGQKSYTSAAEYYSAYLRNYPKGKYSVEACYQVGHCYYLDAPDARLDQEITYQAIDAFQLFIETYPESPYMAQAYKEQNEMYDKLAYKEMLNARLYYNLGTYLGNNYQSAIITAKNALKNYPSNSYQEELNWIILRSKYQEMVNSLESKKVERARDADDECYSFLTEFPESKHRSLAEKMAKDINKVLKKQN
ncbi:MAG: outer membrane protein assembly factor BamD [Paludibacteraceae bacterium]|nr:outer membrane protein assembly factor BamD [Paludibacteraceae bacterium]